MSYIFFNPKIKKVNALGKINACTDDKLGYFFNWPYVKFALSICTFNILLLSNNCLRLLFSGLKFTIIVF